MDLKSCLIVSVLCALAYGTAIPEVKRPEYLQLCARSDPKIDECLKKKFQDLIPHLLTGEPEVQLPSLQKIRLGDVSFTRALTLNANAGISLALSFMHNVESAEVKNVRSNIEDNRMKVNLDIYFPQLYIEGYFRTNMGLNKLTFINEGTFNLSLVDLTTTMAVTGKTYEKNGLKYLQVQHVRFHPKIGEATLVARNQGDGYSTVVDVGAAIVNKYWDVLYSDYIPYIEDKWDLALTNITNQVISNVPYDHLFPSM